MFCVGKQRVLDLSQVNPGNEFLKIGKGIPIAVSMFGVAITFSVANVLCWESSLSSNQAPSKSKCLSQIGINWDKTSFTFFAFMFYRSDFKRKWMSII